MSSNLPPSYEEHVYAMQVASLYDEPVRAYDLAIALFDEVNKGSRGKPKKDESGLKQALESLVLLGEHGSMSHLIEIFFQKKICLCGRSSIGKSISYFIENKGRKIVGDDLNVLLTRNYSAQNWVFNTPTYICHYGASNPNAGELSKERFIIISNHGRPPHRKEVDRKLFIEGIQES